jgi:hypothetical protein
MTELAKVYAQFQDVGIYNTNDEFIALYTQPDYGSRPGMSTEEYRLATSLSAIRQQFEAFSNSASISEAAPKVSAPAADAAAPKPDPGHPVILPFSPPTQPVPTSSSPNMAQASPPASSPSEPRQEGDKLDPQVLFLQQIFEAILVHSPADLGLTPAIDEHILAVQVAFDMDSPERREIMDLAVRRVLIPLMRVLGVTAIHWNPVLPQVSEEGEIAPTLVPDTPEAREAWWKHMIYLQNFIPTSTLRH